jgi:hypothetical protein
MLNIDDSSITVGTFTSIIMCIKSLAVSTQHCFYVQKYAGHREYNCPLELQPELGACFLAQKVHLRYAMLHLVKVLRHKLDDRGSHSRINNWICHWLNTPGHTMFLESTQFLTEKSTTDKGRRCVGLKTLFTFTCWMSRNPGSLKLLEA